MKPLIGQAFFLLSLSCLTAQPVVRNVERPDRPVSLDIQPSVLTLSAGKEIPLTVTGTYRDGSTAVLTKSTKTTYASQDPSVATVTSEGVVKAVAPGDTNIVVNGTILISVTVDGPIRIAPSGVALHASETEQFIAMARDLSDPSITWSADVGSISKTGMYTAPASIDKQQTATVTASSSADRNVSASVKVTLYPPVSVTLSPPAITLHPSGTQQFRAKVVNAADTTVTWSIDPAATGNISDRGLYTAPSSIASRLTVTVTATSLIDKTKSASATITLSPSP